MKLFTVNKEENEARKCNGCNWKVSRLYGLASSQKEADKLYKNDEAGLCGECIADLLVEGEYDIYPKPSPETSFIETEIGICVERIADLWGEPMNGDDVEDTVKRFKKKLAQIMGEEE